MALSACSPADRAQRAHDSRRSNAVTDLSSCTANSAPPGNAAVDAACSATPSVCAVTSPSKLPRGASVARSNRWNTVSGASWSTAIQ